MESFEFPFGAEASCYIRLHRFCFVWFGLVIFGRVNWLLWWYWLKPPSLIPFNFTLLIISALLILMVYTG